MSSFFRDLPEKLLSALPTRAVQMQRVGMGRFFSIPFFREKAFPCRFRARKVFDL